MTNEQRENLEWNLSRMRQLSSLPNYRQLPEYIELAEENEEIRNS